MKTNRIDRRIREIRRLLLISCMMFMLLPAAVSAVDETGRTNYKAIAPGVAESTVYVTTSERENARTHILRITKDAEVLFKVTSAQYYKPDSTAFSRAESALQWGEEDWGFATVNEMADSYESASDTPGQVVAAVNGDFYYDDYNGEPLGRLIMEGNDVNPSSSEPFFAVLEDGSRVMREKGSDTDDVVEAIAGLQWLVNNGSIPEGLSGTWRIMQGLGMTETGDVIFVSVDGREPTSAGITVREMAGLMLQQGCVQALQLDSGGSTSFLTCRQGGTLQYRNTISDADGYPRPVSTALLVVTDPDGKGEAKTLYPASMKNDRTKLVKDSKGVYRYYIKGKKQTGFRTVNGKSYLFNTKGNGWTKKITIGKTRYTYTKGKLTGCSDRKAGVVNIGFCGASNGGKNLLFAYQNGNDVLNIGLNPMIKKNSGKMRNWPSSTEMPWQPKKYRMKSVVIGKGVKNVGNYFARISPNPFNRTLRKTSPRLTSVSLPASLTSIGKAAFYNQHKMKKITIPKKVSRIQSWAFGYQKNVVYTFNRKSPPTFEKNAFKKPASWKKAIWKVPKTKKWKKFARSKTKRKNAGFSGYIRYKK